MKCIGVQVRDTDSLDYSLGTDGMWNHTETSCRKRRKREQYKSNKKERIRNKEERIL